MANPEALCQRLSAAGFQSPQAEKLEFTQAYGGFDDYWDTTLDLAAPITVALRELDDSGVSEIRDAIHGAVAQFEDDDGSLNIPASAIVASARA